MTLDIFPESSNTCHHGELVFFEEVWYFFCGVYSDVNIYSLSNEISIWMETVRCVYSKLQAQFVVVDRGLIITRHYETFAEYESRPVYEEVLLFKPYSFLETFYVEVKKLYRLILKVFLEVDHIVYDSPQLLHNKLKPNNKYYRLTKFQCMVQIFAQKFSFTYEGQFFHKSSEEQNMLLLNKDHNEPLILQLPTIFCEESLCVYFINQTKPGIQLRINITKFSYKGKNDYFCKYGGLAVAEKNQEIQEKVICEDTHRNTTKDKLFYHHTASVILILYWYEGLSSIEGKVTITESECKAVQVNICEMHFKCHRMHRRCERYLNDISRILGVHFF